MRASNLLLPFFLGLAWCSTASAEIYQSKDAQGNTVYSDKPSEGAAAVKVSPTNSADPVMEAPRPPSPVSPDEAATPRKSSTQPASSEHQDTHDDWLYYGDDYDAMDNRARRERRRDNDNVAQPKRDRPAKVAPRPAASRPAGGGSGRR